MSFLIDVDGVKINFKIKGYKITKNEDDMYDNWCESDFIFSNKYFNYKKNDYEILLSYEVDRLVKALNKLIDNIYTETKEISFIEPDFVFLLFPKGEISDISIEWQIYLWDEEGTLTGNFFTITLNKDEIVLFRDYLESVRVNK